MKHIISIVLILLVNFSFGQPKEKEMTLNGDPVILFVAKNNVSSSISVHTYKLNGGIGAQEISMIAGVNSEQSAFYKICLESGVEK